MIDNNFSLVVSHFLLDEEDGARAQRRKEEARVSKRYKSIKAMPDDGSSKETYSMAIPYVAAQLAFYEGILSAAQTLILSGGAVVALTRFSPSFARSFGPSGKVALVSEIVLSCILS
mmetsp:Transcript_11830/g.17706  ORF Transcript_11830/g.17706 Transcript_11830/m.17706 type:complete len:117 (+) Transcript_11830:1003-1353(+)